MGKSINTIIARVRKLLAMAKSPNEFEANRASQKAQELLIEHNLSIADVSDPQDIETIDLMKAPRMIRWKQILLSELAVFYDCRTFRIPSDDGVSVRVIGSPANAQITALMFEYFCLAIDRVCLETKAAKPETKIGPSFRKGVSVRICYKLDDRKKQMLRDGFQAESGSISALVVRSQADRENAKIDAWVEDFYKRKLKTHKVKKIRIDDEFALGYKFGDSIGIDLQIQGQKMIAPGA